MILEFTVSTKPRGAQRPRFGKGRVFTPKADKALRAVIGVAALSHLAKNHLTPDSFNGLPVSLTVLARFANSKIHYGPHTSTPDLDNILKLVMDALTGIVYKDDSAVWHVTCRKELAPTDGIDIRIETID